MHTVWQKSYTALSQPPRFRFWIGGLVFAVGIQFLSCAKPTTVIRSGKEISLEQAAKEDFSQAQNLLWKGQLEKAKAIFQGLVNEQPNSLYADNALLRIGQIWKKQNQSDKAIQTWNFLLSRYPQSDVLNVAREELGKAWIEQKEFSKSAQVLTQIPWNQIEVAKRAELEKMIRLAFERSNQPKEKLYWLISVSNQTQDPMRVASYQKEISTALDEISQGDELREIFERFRPTFPSGHACFKLAKLFYHLGDLENARKWATTFVEQFPKHELHSEGIQLSESLIKSSEVDPLSIGLLIPLRGSKKVFGEQIQRGVAVAMSLFEKKNSVSSPVRIHVEDVGEDTDTAVSALQRLVQEKHVLTVLGPLFSRTSQVVSLAALEYELPVISMSAAEGITDLGEMIFRNSLTKSEQAYGLAHLAKEILGIQRMAILYPSNNYGSEFMSLFWKEFVRRGGEIRGAESYDPSAKNLTTAVKRLVGLEPLELRSQEICSEKESEKRANLDFLGKKNIKMCYPPDRLPPWVDFEAIFVPDEFEKASQIRPTLEYYFIWGVQILGTNLWNTSGILQKTREETRENRNDALEGLIFLDGFFKNSPKPHVQEFIKAFQSRYKEDPGVLEAQAFDSISIVLEILQKNRPTSRKSFANALRNISDFPGVTGSINFTSRDAKRKLTVLTVDHNEIVPLH